MSSKAKEQEKKQMDSRPKENAKLASAEDGKRSQERKSNMGNMEKTSGPDLLRPRQLETLESDGKTKILDGKIDKTMDMSDDDSECDKNLDVRAEICELQRNVKALTGQVRELLKEKQEQQERIARLERKLEGKETLERPRSSATGNGLKKAYSSVVESKTGTAEGKQQVTSNSSLMRPHSYRKRETKLDPKEQEEQEKRKQEYQLLEKQKEEYRREALKCKDEKEFEKKKRDYDQYCQQVEERQRQLTKEREKDKEAEVKQRKEEKEKWENDRAKRLIMTGVKDIGDNDKMNLQIVKRQLDLSGLMILAETEKLDIQARVSRNGHKIFFLIFPSAADAAAVMAKKPEALRRAKFDFYLDRDRKWQDRLP